MKIALLGYGKMGRLIETEALKQGLTVAVKTSHLNTSEALLNADVCLDFSHASCIQQHVRLAAKQGKNLVIGTTGWEEAQADIKKIVADHQIAVLYAPNFSLGVYLFNQLLTEAARLLSPLEAYLPHGSEIHHLQKLDAPSGTAKLLSATLATFYASYTSDAFTSVRQGDVVGTHTIAFSSAVDSIQLTHTAHNRQGFALGALQAAHWIIGKQGFYTLDDMMHSLQKKPGERDA